MHLKVQKFFAAGDIVKIMSPNSAPFIYDYGLVVNVQANESFQTGPMFIKMPDIVSVITPTGRLIKFLSDDARILRLVSANPDR